MSVRKLDRVTGVATTTDASVATLCDTPTIPAGATVVVLLTLQGRETNNGDVVASCMLQMSAYRPTAGALTLRDSGEKYLVTLIEGSDSASGLVDATPEIVLNGNALRAQVTGALGSNGEWFADMQFWIN